MQPDGERLSDPDLIRPGWQLTIPTTTARCGRLHTTTTQPPAQQPDRPARGGAARLPATDSPTGATDTPGSGTEAVDDERLRNARLGHARAGRSRNPPRWLTAARPAPTPTHPAALPATRPHHRSATSRSCGRSEKTAHLVGTITAPKIDLLDRALRHLAAACSEVPRLRFVELTDRESPCTWRTQQTCRNRGAATK